MRKRDDNSQPVGIYQRFINFICCFFCPQRPHLPVEVPIEESNPSINNRQGNESSSSSSSEIEVEFRPIGSLENSNSRVDYQNSSKDHDRGGIGLNGQKNGFRNKDSNNNLSGEGIKVVNKPNGEIKPRPRVPWVLMGAKPDVDKEAEYFIKRKMEAMHGSNDPKED